MASELEKQLKELEKSQKKGVLTEEEYQQRRAALIANGASTKASGGKSGLLKFGMVGCLGVIGGAVLLVVLVVVLISAAVSSSDSTTEVEAKDVHVPLTQGTTAEIWPGNLDKKRTKVTILQLVDGASSTNQFSTPAEGKKYFALEVALENVGSQEVGSLDWKMRDSNDKELDRSFVSGIGESLESVGDLTPGGKVQGWVVFEMDATATPKWIRADPNPFVSNDLYFDAQ